ncbi:hypothetical protein F0562_014732 [Nyssa sinensis]|uniref:C2H2-type domain-containing protein n=1 Tax=Nyssa sinensis TaxID=561372 RepID=A0A5J4ZRU3_9ASTE|nr:hypothetical protein F0562_014732 [Nyssa sinensis]
MIKSRKRLIQLQSSSSEEEENEDKELGYGLRENPKKSVRLVDPEFSFGVDAGSVVLQDRESETESSKNPIRRRSKRIRKSGITEHHRQYQDQCFKESELKKLKLGKHGKNESSWPWAEPEPVSSISDTTPEEDVAYCLMMLSRDKWMRKEDEFAEQAEEEESKKYMDDQTDEPDELKNSKARARGKYKCETCYKVFRSYHALGGHRASHKKIKVHSSTSTQEPSEIETRNAALGGHKRSHVTTASSAATPAKPPSKFAENLIDLNLPAPIDDDDTSQFELSAVSDAEFVNPINR